MFPFPFPFAAVFYLRELVLIGSAGFEELLIVEGKAFPSSSLRLFLGGGGGLPRPAPPPLLLHLSILFCGSGPAPSFDSGPTGQKAWLDSPGAPLKIKAQDLF